MNTSTERRYTGRDPASFGFEQILYRKEGGVATVTFNRPQALNAVNYPLLAESSVAFQDAAWDDSVAATTVAVPSTVTRALMMPLSPRSG